MQSSKIESDTIGRAPIATGIGSIEPRNISNLAVDNALIMRAMVGRSVACKAAITSAATGSGRLTVGELTRDGMRRELAVEVVSFLDKVRKASRPSAGALTRPAGTPPPVARSRDAQLPATLLQGRDVSSSPPAAAKPSAASVTPESKPVEADSRDRLASAKWCAPNLQRDKVETAICAVAQRSNWAVPGLRTPRQVRLDAYSGLSVLGTAVGAVASFAGVIAFAETAAVVGTGPVIAGATLLGAGAPLAALSVIALVKLAGPASEEMGPCRLGPGTLVEARAVANARQAHAVIASLRAHGVLHPQARGNGYLVVDTGPLREALVAADLTAAGLTIFQRSRVEQVTRYVHTTAAARRMAADLAARAKAARGNFDRGLIGADTLRAALEAAEDARRLLETQKEEHLTWTEARDLP